MKQAAQRIASVDIVRGAVMVLMALDHVRDWVSNIPIRPEDLTRSWAALFFTRWVTHFCAPTFFLLAGVGIGILASRGIPRPDLTRFLLTRGVWLLVLELVITPLGWQFGFQLVPAFALVLWALGWSMIIMAAVVHLPPKSIAAAALVIIAGHNLLDRISPDSLGAFAGVWRVLHVPGFAVPGVLFIGYPLVPWVAVMATGFLLGRVYEWDPPARRRFLLSAGTLLTLVFVTLRFVNEYGDPGRWTPQRTRVLTIASFLNVTKYPPSLLFLLMTLGPALIALALTEESRGRIARWLSIYGRVPLFFYVVHIFVAHAVAMTLAFIQSGHFRRIKVITDIGSLPEWYGVPLSGVYFVWAIVVISLYFPCRRFAQLKASRAAWWLRYL
jgi:uncharacterized membrane protein